MDLAPSHHLFVWSKYKGANPIWLLDICQEARNLGCPVLRAPAQRVDLRFAVSGR
jgi:hypothetical protein